MSFQFTILEDKLNLMLNRRELKIFLKSAAGKISKIELVKIIAKNFNEDEKKIFPISLDGEKPTLPLLFLSMKMRKLQKNICQSIEYLEN